MEVDRASNWEEIKYNSKEKKDRGCEIIEKKN